MVPKTKLRLLDQDMQRPRLLCASREACLGFGKSSWGRHETSLLVALAISASASQDPPTPSREITAADVAAAQTLLDQIKGLRRRIQPKACGILAYSPEDCTIKKTDPHIRQVLQHL